LSTPLREVIPESPNDEADPFPDLGVATPAHEKVPSLGHSTADYTTPRRGRAGTAPSRPPPGLAPPVGAIGQQPGQAAAGARQEMSGSPFRPGSASLVEAVGSLSASTSPASASALLSRIRAGSMPQKASLLSSQTPFGPTVFSTSYNRGRASTLSGLLPDSPSSPPAQGYRKDSLNDADIRTLDYLGLVDPSPVSGSASNAGSDAANLMELGRRLPGMASARVPSSRFRSYSVNAKEKYALEQDQDEHGGDGAYYSGMLTPSAEATAQALAITQAQIRQHNLDVQAFANAAAASRPRAQTAGLLDAPSSRLWRGYSQQQVEQLDEEEVATDDLVNQMQDAMQAIALQDLAAQSQPGLNVDHRMVYDDATRALWLGNIPPSTTTSSLKMIFEAYGKIESARVLTHKSCGFINFDTVDSALQAKADLDGKEIFPGAGPIRIGYAKVQSTVGTPMGDGYIPSQSPAPQQMGRSVMSVPSFELAEPVSGLSGNVPLPAIARLPDISDEVLKIVQVFGATEQEAVTISSAIERAVQIDNFENDIPPALESPHGRIHDAPKLREIRKRIDNNACTPQELEDIALAMLPEVAELASDYLGNTVVQKLFEFCSEPIKEAMLAELGPHLSEIGVHKNGTWAAQKVIDVARTSAQMDMIVDGLRPYGVAMFLDQYGNYVMQCCLRFGVPFNNFIFDVMLTRMWEVSQGRFGARAMRACLESHHASKDQQRMLAAIIALNSVRLSMNTNGALLLTWYLDTCTFPGRRAVLAPLLIPHLIELCTHKVAYLTILKIVNQRNEPAARDALLEAIFFSEDNHVLSEILKDQTCGATLVFKILTTPFFEENKRAEAIQTIRSTLLELKVPQSQGYKRLLDEVGLSTRSVPGVISAAAPSSLRDSLGATSSSDGASRPTSKTGMQNGSDMSQQPNPAGYFPVMPPQQFNPAASQNGGYPPYDPFTARQGGPPPMQYQQRGAPPPQMYGYNPEAYRAVMAQQAARYGQMPPQMGMPPGMGRGGLGGFDPAVLHMWAQQQGYHLPPGGGGPPRR